MVERNMPRLQNGRFKTRGRLKKIRRGKDYYRWYRHEIFYER